MVTKRGLWESKAVRTYWEEPKGTYGFPVRMGAHASEQFNLALGTSQVAWGFGEYA